MKIAAAAFYLYVANIDIATGRDLKVYETGNYLTCEDYCSKNEKCRGFIVSRAQGKCWLKDTLDGIKGIKIESIGAVRLNRN